jgi:Zn-dependent peptidase ImmA (M78 family)
LIRTRIGWLPIDPFKIAEQYGWEVHTVADVSEKSRVLYDEVIDGQDSDVYEYDGKYKIVYNENAHRDRIPYTIAHEIGHIVLNHLIDFDQTKLSRGGLTDEEYSILEREAELFASELLMPTPILKEIGAWKEDEIQCICCVSKSASHYKERDLGRGPIRSSYILTDKIKSQFALYLYRVTVCMYPQLLLVKSVRSFNPRGVALEIKHPYVQIDEYSRFIECPRCGNRHFSDKAKYCKMCGLHLYNICTFVDEDRDYPSFCGERNSGDARYCEYCGAETTLTHLGLLMTWEEVIGAHGEIAAGLLPPFRDDTPATLVEEAHDIDFGDENPPF